MDAHEVDCLRAALGLFVADVFASVPRKDQRGWGECYLRGLMLDGRRKSIQPMAARLPDGSMQALQQFVSQSPWEWTPVRRRIAERLCEVIRPEVWVVDDVSFPKCGKASVGVARQYCGALGKRASCQVAVSVYAATDTASCPLEWALFLPEQWADDARRRRAAAVSDDVGHVPKSQLALGLLDRLAGSGGADCTLEDRQARVELTASHITNAPEELLTAVAQLVAGETETRAQFEAEPRPPTGGSSTAKAWTPGPACWSCVTAAITTTREPRSGPASLASTSSPAP